MAEQKASNKHLGGGVEKDDYVKVRENATRRSTCPTGCSTRSKSTFEAVDYRNRRLMETATSRYQRTGSDHGTTRKLT